MFLPNILFTSTFLSKLLPQFLIFNNCTTILLAYENQTKDLTDITLKIISNETIINRRSVYIRNVVETNHMINPISNQGLFIIVSIQHIINSCDWIININKTIPIYPRFHILILTKYNNSMNFNLSMNSVINSLWNISLINVGFIILDEINQIFTYNPYLKNRVIKIYSSNSSNLLSPSVVNEIYRKTYSEKLSNLNGSIFPIMTALDWGRIYLKQNPNIENSLSLGGSEVYTMSIIAKRLNANIVYNLQTVRNENVTDLELLEYYNKITMPINIEYDKFGPDTIIPKIYGLEENL